MGVASTDVDSTIGGLCVPQDFWYIVEGALIYHGLLSIWLSELNLVTVDNTHLGHECEDICLDRIRCLELGPRKSRSVLLEPISSASVLYGAFCHTVSHRGSSHFPHLLDDAISPSLTDLAPRAAWKATMPIHLSIVGVVLCIIWSVFCFSDES